MASQNIQDKRRSCQQQCDAQFIDCVDASRKDCLDRHKRCYSFCSSMTMEEMAAQYTGTPARIKPRPGR